MKTNIRAAWLVVILGTVFSSIALADPIEDELNRLEEARYTALIGKDWQALDTIFADDFIYNTGTGATFTKSSYLDFLKSGAGVVKSADREPASVRTYGDVALVTGVAHVDVTIKGEDKALHSRYLHVWTRHGGTWRLSARQATYLPEKK